MKRLFLSLVVLMTWAAAAWGALPTVTLEARYTDDGSTVDLANITPYRDVELRWLTVADTPTITYNAFVHGDVKGNITHNIHNQGTISTNVSPIPYSLKVTFDSEEEGEISFFPKDANEMTGASQHNFKVLKGIPPTVKVTGVKIGEDSILSTPAASMEIELDTDWNKSKTLKATVEPENATNKKVTWTSDKATVVTVNNGRIDAKGPGEATITATTEDGGFTATCKVTVTRNGANSITIDPTSITMAPGDVRTIWVKFDEMLASYQKVIISIEPEIVTASIGIITASSITYDLTGNKPGTATLTASTEGAKGQPIKAICEITITAPDDQDPQNPDGSQEPKEPEEPEKIEGPTNPDNVRDNEPKRSPDSNNNKTSGSSGGGCNGGYLGLALLAALIAKAKR